VVRNTDGNITGNVDVPIASFNTVTVSTIPTALWAPFGEVVLSTFVTRGTAVVASTTTFIFCSAMILEAQSSSPQGIALHLVRFNPMPGTTE